MWTLQQNSKSWLPFSCGILELVVLACRFQCLRVFSYIHPTVELGTFHSFSSPSPNYRPGFHDDSHAYWCVPACFHSFSQVDPHDRLWLQTGVPETHSVFLSSHTRAVLCCLDHCLSFCFHMKINYFQIWLKDFLWSHTKWAFVVFNEVGRWWCEMFSTVLN